MKFIYNINNLSQREGHLYIENVKLADIAIKYKTPCYVYSKKTIIDTFKKYKQACYRNDQNCADIYYSVKANSNLAILNLLANLESGFDIVSGGELARVLAAGGDPNRVIFSGVGKTAKEIKDALLKNIKCFNIESIAELININKIAKSINKIANIAIRINPNVDAETHPYISTGLETSKFGIPYQDAIETYTLANNMSHCKIIGIDCHIGSQITEISPYLNAIEKILLLISKLYQYNIKIKHINIGGGLGICYKNENIPDITMFVQTILDYIYQKNDKRYKFSVLFEPGRSLVGNAGMLLTQILYIKNGKKNFCIIDAAMNDLIRPAMYNSYHRIVPCFEKNDIQSEIYDIVGPICESGDWIGKERVLKVNSGDYLAILSAGAYCFTMSSNYNSRGRPPEIIVDDSSFFLIRERETILNLFSLEHIRN